MHKNQLQELSQRSCFNLPSYACIRKGPDHAPRFKATVTFNGESFESPNFCNTLRHAEHAAAEVALNTLSRMGPTQSLAARILDETGVCKNLLQETAQRAGVKLPCYTTVRSGPGHLPVFTCTVELAGMSFTGESAKTKKQAEKNAATAAWASLKQLVIQGSSLLQSTESDANDEQEQIIIARVLATLNNDDKSCRASGARTTNPMHHASTVKYQPRVAGPGPTSSRINALPFSESSVQAGTSMQEPYNSSSWMSMDLKASGSLEQRHPLGRQHGDVLAKSGSSYHSSMSHKQHSSIGAPAHAAEFPRDLNIVDQFAAHEIGNLAWPMQVKGHILSVVPGTERHVRAFSVEEHKKDDEEQFHRENSAVLNHDNSSFSSRDTGFPMVQLSYNPMGWAYPNHCLNMAAQQKIHPATISFRAAASLAPPVRVRPMVAVYSAPPCVSGSEDQEWEMNGEAATQEVLSQLRL